MWLWKPSSPNGSCVVDCIFLVDHKLLGDFRPCPFGVSSVSGQWRVTASIERPGQDAYCLFLMAFNQVGFVGNPALAWQQRTSSGLVFSSQTLWIASVGGGRSGRNSVGGQFTAMVSMLLFRTTSTSGMHQRFDLVSIHPRRLLLLMLGVLRLRTSLMIICTHEFMLVL